MPIVVVLYLWDFSGHDYWATALFAVAMATDWFDGRVARRTGRSSALGSLLDPIADKLLVLTVMIVLIGRDVFPAWMVAAIVARELLISGLRLAALERGVVLQARDLGRAEDLDTGRRRRSRRACRGRSDRRFDRGVGPRRRARADLDLGARLRPARAGPAPWRPLGGRRRRRARAGLDVLEHAGQPPDAAIGVCVRPSGAEASAASRAARSSRVGSGVISISIP